MKEELLARLEGLGIYKLEIIKDAAVRGREVRKFIIGNTHGGRRYEHTIELAKNMGLTIDGIAAILRSMLESEKNYEGE